MSDFMTLKRCDWSSASQQYIDYHDKEWGVPVHDDCKLFEMLILEGVQAGLSWSFLHIQIHFGSYDVFIWQCVDGRPQQHAWRSMSDVPASTRESNAKSKELKQRGFTFVGSTISYAFMQSVGMVNEHIVECFRW